MRPILLCQWRHQKWDCQPNQILDSKLSKMQSMDKKKLGVFKIGASDTNNIFFHQNNTLMIKAVPHHAQVKSGQHHPEIRRVPSSQNQGWWKLSCLKYCTKSRFHLKISSFFHFIHKKIFFFEKNKKNYFGPDLPYAPCTLLLLLLSDEKLKLGKMVEELHFGRCSWFGGCGWSLKTLSKALIFSKSPKYSKLDSLAYNYGMRVFTYIPQKMSNLKTSTSTTAGIFINEAKTWLIKDAS